MTIEERHDGTILVTYDSTRLTWLMLAVGGVCLATAGYDVFIGSRGTDRLASVLGAAGTCLLVAIVFLDIDGYWGPMLAMFDRAVAAGFLRPSHRALAQRAGSVDEAKTRAEHLRGRRQAMLRRFAWVAGP
jgi:hypothetical protein